jgi:CRP-like cAMP-binding protein
MSEKQVRKHKERASRLIAKGKYPDALSEYQKAVRIDPKDLSLRQKLAETFGRMGRREDAIHEYMTVAGSYAADGLLLKAIAINKVILGLDPSHTETQDALAELYAKKRGDFHQPVKLPKSMSAAITGSASTGRKRSASEIRGIPSSKISTSNTSKAAVQEALQKSSAAGMDDSIDVDIDIDSADVEVISVEEAGATADAPSVAPQDIAPIQTNIQAMQEMIQEQSADDVSVDLDIDVVDATPAVVMGTALPTDEGVAIVDDDDDGDYIEVAEAEVQADDLPPIPLFSDLSKNAFIALTERMDLVQAEAGEILIAEGEYAASMYIVIQGNVKVVRELEGGDELKLAELSDGTFFGEMALLSDAPRTASVIATEDTMLFEISRDLMNEITKEYPSVEQVMKRFHRNRLLTNLLRTSPIFAPFSPSDKRALIEKFKSRNVGPGKLLITRDKPGDGLYVLLSGRCEVLGKKDEDGPEVVLAELKEGDVFGEMSLLFRQHATASVRTTSPAIVLRLPKQNFDSLIMTHPQVLEALSQLSSEREEFNRELLDSDDEELADFLV